MSRGAIFFLQGLTRVSISYFRDREQEEDSVVEKDMSSFLGPLMSCGLMSLVSLAGTVALIVPVKNQRILEYSFLVIASATISAKIKHLSSAT